MGTPCEAAVLDPDLTGTTWEEPDMIRWFFNQGGGLAYAMDPIFQSAMYHDEVIGDRGDDAAYL